MLAIPIQVVLLAGDGTVAADEAADAATGAAATGGFLIVGSRLKAEAAALPIITCCCACFCLLESASVELAL